MLLKHELDSCRPGFCRLPAILLKEIGYLPLFISQDRARHVPCCVLEHNQIHTQHILTNEKDHE